MAAHGENGRAQWCSEGSMALPCWLSPLYIEHVSCPVLSSQSTLMVTREEEEEGAACGGNRRRCCRRRRHEKNRVGFFEKLLFSSKLVEGFWRSKGKEYFNWLDCMFWGLWWPEMMVEIAVVMRENEKWEKRERGRAYEREKEMRNEWGCGWGKTFESGGDLGLSYKMIKRLKIVYA